jgi:hypothetical protein
MLKDIIHAILFCTVLIIMELISKKYVEPRILRK